MLYLEGNVMSNVSGRSSEDFVDFIKWLELIKGLLPSKMSLREANEIFLRRKQEKTFHESKASNCS